MARIRNNLCVMAAGLAAFSMSATPAVAAEIPRAGPAQALAYDSDAENVEGHRWRRHRHRGVDAGDVIAGVLVLGAVAAIASSASNNRDRRREREREDIRYRQREPDRRDYDNRSYNSRGIDNAVDMCVDQLERGNDRVSDIDNATRDGSGWDVSGRLDSGDRFSCRIDNEGRIRNIDIGGGYSSYTPAPATGPQLSDADYARARAATRYESQSEPDSYEVDYGDEPRPAYPGGPLPGESDADEDGYIDGDLYQSAAR